MVPKLQKVILNGASRHCLKKGFILVGDEGQIDLKIREKIIQGVNKILANQPDLANFVVETRPAHVSLISLNTPFLPVYDVSHRDDFINRLAKATTVLIHVLEQCGYHLSAAGVNPFFSEDEKRMPALCADIHQVEVFDDGEIERVYNLYRQFLPELLAVSTHSAVYGGALQKDFSLRMRLNPSGFLPRYISQFSSAHLDKLRNMMRRDYGLADLRQMDINPLAGDPGRLLQDNPPLLLNSPAAAELRFIDAQCSFPFIRAQVVLFQAIAMYGRSLARRGKRLPYMQDEVIDENKALSVQCGPGAVLKPDPKFKKDNGGKGYSFHDTGTSERVTTSLLMIIDGLLMPYLRELECQYQEICPIVLGAELRRRGYQCFANYAEYQKFLHYANPGRFKPAFSDQVKHLLTSPRLDYITAYNHKAHTGISNEINSQWKTKLAPKPRYKGKVIFFDHRERSGILQNEQGREFRFQVRDIEGMDRLYNNQPVTFEIVERRGQPQAKSIRPGITEKYEGYVTHYDDKGFGFIKTRGKPDIFVHSSDIMGGQKLLKGDIVLFEIVDDEKGPRALRVKIKERPGPEQQTPTPRQQGKVKWFDPKKKYGYIVTDSGQDVYVHQKNLEGLTTLDENQRVSFEVGKSNKGLRANRVRPLND